MNKTETTVLFNEVTEHQHRRLDRFSRILKLVRFELSVSAVFDLGSFNSKPEHKYETPEAFRDFINKCSNVQLPALYIIGTEEPIALSEVYNDFRKPENLPPKLCRSKDNRLDEQGVQSSNTLYVGSKIKDLHTRMRQHFGLISPTVYSLHLCHWYLLPQPITIDVFEVHNLESLDEIDSQTQTPLEFIEQGLWSIKRPMFGKSS